MLRFILKNRLYEPNCKLSTERLLSVDAYVPDLEQQLSRGGFGAEQGYDITDILGVEILTGTGFAAQEEKESGGTASNSDYAAAERVYREWCQWSNISVEKIAFIPWLERRLNSAKAPNCA